MPTPAKDSIYVAIGQAGVFVGLALVSTLAWFLGSRGSPNVSGLFLLVFVIGGAVGHAVAPQSALVFVIPTALTALIYLLPALRISRAAGAAVDSSKRRMLALCCWGYPILFSILLVFPQANL